MMNEEELTPEQDSHTIEQIFVTVLQQTLEALNQASSQRESSESEDVLPTLPTAQSDSGSVASFPEGSSLTEPSSFPAPITASSPGLSSSTAATSSGPSTPAETDSDIAKKLQAALMHHKDSVGTYLAERLAPFPDDVRASMATMFTPEFLCALTLNDFGFLLDVLPVAVWHKEPIATHLRAYTLRGLVEVWRFLDLAAYSLSRNERFVWYRLKHMTPDEARKFTEGDQVWKAMTSRINALLTFIQPRINTIDDLQYFCSHFHKSLPGYYVYPANFLETLARKIKQIPRALEQIDNLRDTNLGDAFWIELITDSDKSPIDNVRALLGYASNDAIWAFYQKYGFNSNQWLDLLFDHAAQYPDIKYKESLSFNFCVRLKPYQDFVFSLDDDHLFKLFQHYLSGANSLSQFLSTTLLDNEGIKNTIQNHLSKEKLQRVMGCVKPLITSPEALFKFMRLFPQDDWRQVMAVYRDEISRFEKDEMISIDLTMNITLFPKGYRGLSKYQEMVVSQLESDISRYRHAEQSSPPCDYEGVFSRIAKRLDVNKITDPSVLLAEVLLQYFLDEQKGSYNKKGMAAIFGLFHGPSRSTEKQDADCNQIVEVHFKAIAAVAITLLPDYAHKFGKLDPEKPDDSSLFKFSDKITPFMMLVYINHCRDLFMGAIGRKFNALTFEMIPDSRFLNYLSDLSERLEAIIANNPRSKLFKEIGTSLSKTYTAAGASSSSAPSPSSSSMATSASSSSGASSSSSSTTTGASSSSGPSSSFSFSSMRTWFLATVGSQEDDVPTTRGPRQDRP